MLVNTGRTTCTLQGWPGVSLIDAHGRQLGASARLDRTGTHPTVTLRPHRAAHAHLHYSEARAYPERTCHPVHGHTRLRIYPPGSRTAITIPAGFDACRNPNLHLLRVQALHPKY